jgi:hypothetical protein
MAWPSNQPDDDWQPMDTLLGTPLDDGRCVLVYLDRKILGSRVHTMRTGKLKLVMGLFLWDVGAKMLRWRPLPPDPVDIDPALLAEDK